MAEEKGETPAHDEKNATPSASSAPPATVDDESDPDFDDLDGEPDCIFSVIRLN